MNTINVTKTYLPTLEDYNSYLQKIWESGWLTNNGSCLQTLESKLVKRFKTKHVIIVSNATLGLQIAIKAMGLTGEIITTPFSYVATTSSIVWEKCKPVFVDICPTSLTIDPQLIEAKITKQTQAILTTHVYGIPCDITTINQIAKKYKLKVIYDAAHCFDVQVENNPIVNFGDASIVSFHATKLFHTCEGGAIVTNNTKLAKTMHYLRNFGHNGPEAFWGEGTNSKMSELHAAMGLCVLPTVRRRVESLKRLTRVYDSHLDWSRLRKPKADIKYRHNYSYYPVIFPSESSLKKCQEKLNDNNVFPRRYFYPALTRLPYVEAQSAPIAEDISKRVMCLPLYSELEPTWIEQITRIVNHSIEDVI